MWHLHKQGDCPQQLACLSPGKVRQQRGGRSLGKRETHLLKCYWGDSVDGFGEGRVGSWQLDALRPSARICSHLSSGGTLLCESCAVGGNVCLRETSLTDILHK